jgi:hypothetical protein
MTNVIVIIAETPNELQQQTDKFMSYMQVNHQAQEHAFNAHKIHLPFRQELIIFSANLTNYNNQYQLTIAYTTKPL